MAKKHITNETVKQTKYIIISLLVSGGVVIISYLDITFPHLPIQCNNNKQSRNNQ